ALSDLYLGPPWIPCPQEAIDFDADEAHAIYARTDWDGNCSVRRVADDVELYHLPGQGRPVAGTLQPGRQVHLDRALRRRTKDPCSRGVAAGWLDGTTPAERIRRSLPQSSRIAASGGELSRRQHSRLRTAQRKRAAPLVAGHAQARTRRGSAP